MSDPLFETLRASFDQLSVAVLILSASRELLFANRPAKAMLETGWPIRLLDGCLQGKDRSATAALNQAFALLLSGEENTALSPYEVCIAHPSTDRPGAIAHLRLLNGSGRDRANIALFIVQSGAERHHGIEGLAGAYGLSKAETRTLKTLMETEGQAEAAARLGVAVSTIKSHLRKIFQKTNTDRQSHLVGLVESARTPFRKAGDGKS